MDEARRMTSAAGVVGFYTLVSRILGLVRDIVVGYLFGAQEAADAFFVAFRIPNLFRRLTAEGALTVGFIPVFTDTLLHHGREEALRVARIVFTLATLALGVLTLLGIVWAGPLIHLFAPGFLADHGKFQLTVFLTRILFPYIFLVSLVALSMGVLNSFRHFAVPALSPALLNLSIVLCALLFSPWLREPVLSLGIGVLLGGFAQLALQVPYLSRFGFSFRPDFDFRHPAVRRLLFLMGPALFGIAVYQVNILVSTMLASMLPEGSVSYLYYADRLLQFPLGIFAVALGTAALPSFSSLVAQKNFGQLRADMAYGLRLINFISLPAMLGLMVLAVPIFSLLFQRGAFDVPATLSSARALVYFALGLWSVSGVRLIVPVFYAMEDMKTPVRVAFWTFLLNILFSLVLMGPVSGGADSSALAKGVTSVSQVLGIFSLSFGGLALATSISATFQFFLLLGILHRRLGDFPWREMITSFYRNLLNALLMAFALFWVVQRVPWIQAEKSLTVLLSQWAYFVFLPVAGLLLYGILSFVLRSPDWEIAREIMSRISKRKP